MDLSLFYFIHGLAGQSAWGDSLIVFFAEYYLYVVLLVFVGVALYQYSKVKVVSLFLKYGTALLGALIARFGVATFIRHFYHHERPYIAIAGLSHLLSDSAYSFPSGHTIFMFALAACTHFFNKKLAYYLYASGLVIGMARIAAGVHYPSDILGGIVIGMVTGAIVYLICSKIIYILRPPHHSQSVTPLQ